MFFSVTLIFQILQLFNCNTEVGRVGNVVVQYVDTCRNEPASSDISCNMAIKEIDSEGNKGFFCNFTTSIVLDNTTTVEMTLYKWNTAGWKLLDIHKYNFCESTLKYFSKVWYKLLEAVTPPPGDVCFLPPGEYSINNFQVSLSDIDIPSYYYGLVQRISKIYKNGKMILCLMSEELIQPYDS
ncbi:hypothetical protein FQR65_LT07233 [Abscondita terminalis]|nr:hypothetical protein FQR65_LT07233 [Abscondita terminalis]